MHPATDQSQAPRGTLPALVLGAMLCLASAGALAASAKPAGGPALSTSPAQAKAASPAAVPADDDECESDEVEVPRVGALPAAPARPAATPAAAPSKVALAAAPVPASSKALAAAPAAATSTPLAAAAAAAPSTPLAAAPAAAPSTPLAAVVEVTGTRTAPPPPVWEVVPSDKTLKAALTRWTAAANWQLVWELPVDYAVSVRTEIKGSFSEAVETVAKSMETAEMPMKAIFYEGNRVLRIVAK